MNKSYSQLGSVEKTSLVSWWALDSAVLGSELITDGDFSSSDNWADITGWTIDTAQQKAIYVPPEGNSSYNIMGYTDATLNASAEYEITITIDSCDNFSNCGFIKGGTIRAFNPTILNSTGTTTFSIVLDRTDFKLWSQNASITISNVSVKEKNVHTDSKDSNNGVNIGATTTTSVYGGNAPILPRAIDIAESQAEQIGDGSALFNGSSDYIDLGDTFQSLFQSPFSMTCWIKLVDGQPSAENNIIGAKGGSNIYFSVTTAGKLQLYINRGSEVTALSASVVFSNGQEEWHHIAFSVTSSQISFYKNGILQTLDGTYDGDVSSLDFSGWSTDKNLFIGARNNAGTADRFFGGNISGVGLWQGALSQAQIQSLIESTSYAKIPADVKSTLGSNFFTDSTFDLSGTQSASTTGTYWTTGSAWTILNGEAIYDATVHENRLELPSATLQSAGLYKFSFTVSDANTKAAFKIKADGNDIIATNYYNNGDHVIYYNQTGAYGSAKTIKIEARNDVHGAFKLQSASWKLVTNDLVAYYPLDADSSRGNGTDNVVTGETLGSEMVGSGFYTLSNWVSSNTESNPTATSVKFVRGSDSQGGAIYLRSENNRLTTNLTVGTIYKITFTYTTDDADAYPAIKDSSNNYYSFGATSGEKVLYYKAVHATFDRIMFQGVSAGTFVQIADVSIKEVTSNTGVLK